MAVRGLGAARVWGQWQMDEAVPLRLQRTDDGALLIAWSDGLEQRLPVNRLQQMCPCATCRERRGGEPGALAVAPLAILPMADAPPLQITRMEPVGNYAYSIDYNRGCSKGIYTFEYLRSLG